MTKVKRSTGKTKAYFKHQEFFADFNWNGCEPGDIIWLEDYPSEVRRIAGIFQGFDEDQAAVIRLIPNRDGAILDRHESETIKGYGQYWQKYLK